MPLQFVLDIAGRKVCILENEGSQQRAQKNSKRKAAAFLSAGISLYP
jgi:hypothetical protein